MFALYNQRKTYNESDHVSPLLQSVPYMASKALNYCPVTSLSSAPTSTLLTNSNQSCWGQGTARKSNLFLPQGLCKCWFPAWNVSPSFSTILASSVHSGLNADVTSSGCLLLTALLSWVGLQGRLLPSAVLSKVKPINHWDVHQQATG